MVSSLVLTLTRACDHRCSYCPTAKADDDTDSLGAERAVRALELFADRFDGGDVKVFGGEPLLEPEATMATLDAAERLEAIGRVWLSTNGVALDERWLTRLAERPKTVLAISLDGTAETHRRHRRARPGVPDAYDRLMALLPRLASLRRVVVTMTVAPDAAGALASGFAHLRSLGLRRFNLLPAYYLMWTAEQIAALRTSLGQIATAVRTEWDADRALYLRNLFVMAPTPLFNTALVVDVDGRLYASNVGQASALSSLLQATRVGSLDAPPSAAELRARAAEVPALLERAVPEPIRCSTLAVDAELGRFCRGLYPHYIDYRKRKRQVA